MEKDASADASPESPPPALLIFEHPEKLGGRPAGGGLEVDMPYRWLISGPPNSGKRNLALNILFRQEPPSAIHIVHVDPDTVEYSPLEMLGCPMFYYSADDFPTIENISDPDPPPVGDSETADEEEPIEGMPEPVDPADREEAGSLGAAPLVIVDEITSDLLSSEGKTRFERLMNYGSSHKNCSVICSIQSIVNLPPKVRRAFQLFTLWPQSAAEANTLAATRAGIPPAMLTELFEGLCQSRHDSITVDSTKSPDSPFRLRLNVLTPIRAAETVRYKIDR